MFVVPVRQTYEKISTNGDIEWEYFDHNCRSLSSVYDDKNRGTSYKNLSYYQHDCSKLNQDRLLNSFRNLDFKYLEDYTLGINSKLNRFLYDLNDLVERKILSLEINLG